MLNIICCIINIKQNTKKHKKPVLKFRLHTVGFTGLRLCRKEECTAQKSSTGLMALSTCAAFLLIDENKRIIMNAPMYGRLCQSIHNLFTCSNPPKEENRTKIAASPNGPWLHFLPRYLWTVIESNNQESRTRKYTKETAFFTLTWGEMDWISIYIYLVATM